MSAHNSRKTLGLKAASGNTAVWLWLSIVAAVLGVTGNLIALSIRSLYAGLTPVFLPQAQAQDIANLTVIAPVWLIVTILALRGSLRAYLLWLGVLTFTVYNYVIYTFSVPFGPLFLLWVAVLGLSTYALIGGITALDHPKVQSAFTARLPVSVVAWFLIIVGLLFGMLWLSEDVPAVLSGTTPQTLLDMALPTNPVHVLDLGFFLPAVIVTGLLLLRGTPLAYAIAPALIVFLILTGVPILLMPVVQAARGDPVASGPTVPIGLLTLMLIALLGWLLATMCTGHSA